MYVTCYWHKIQSHQFGNPFFGTLARPFHFRQWLHVCAVKTGASYFGNLFSTCQQVLGHACHTWYSLWLKSLTHNHSTRAAQSVATNSHAPDLQRPQRVLRHEKLRNYVTWPAWENWNVFQFNWCLYRSEISDCKSPWPYKCTTILFLDMYWSMTDIPILYFFVNFPHKGQWCGDLMFSSICAWTKCCVNNRDAGDLRRHRAHFDIAVMLLWGV